MSESEHSVSHDTIIIAFSSCCLTLLIAISKEWTPTTNTGRLVDRGKSVTKTKPQSARVLFLPSNVTTT